MRLTVVRCPAIGCAVQLRGASLSVTITNADLNRLQPNEFLNDTLIEFYLRYSPISEYA